MKKSNTVLVTMELKGKLYFAADRRISWGMGKAAESPVAKVSKRNGILMSGTGHASIVFDIIHRCKFPKYRGRDPEEFIHHKFLPAIIKDLRHRGLVDERERRLVSGRDKSDYLPSVVILVGLKEKKKSFVYELELSSDHIAVDSVPVDYAHGCGGDYALGALTFMKDWDFRGAIKVKDKSKADIVDGKEYFKLTTARNYEILKLSPEEMLTQAIEIAAQHSPGCDNKVDICVL